MSKHDQILSVLHIMTRLELTPDSKLLDKLSKAVLQSVDKLTNAQQGGFMESLLNLGYQTTPQVNARIIHELEARQKALLVTNGKEGDGNGDTTNAEKLNIQEGLKIFRGIF
jgi:hypothetical protein